MYSTSGASRDNPPGPTRWLSRTVLCGFCNFDCCHSPALQVECTPEESKRLSLPMAFKYEPEGCRCLTETGCKHGDARPAHCKLFPLSVTPNNKLGVARWAVLRCPTPSDFIEQPDGTWTRRPDISSTKRGNTKEIAPGNPHDHPNVLEQGREGLVAMYGESGYARICAAAAALLGEETTVKRNAVPSTEWQQGYDLDWLKAVTAVFATHDACLILGAFTRTSERTVAEWAVNGELKTRLADGAAVVIQRPKTARKWEDFAGEPRATIKPGDIVIRKIAGTPTAVDAMTAEARKGGKHGWYWFEGWMESPADRAFVERHGLVPCGVKVRASSELWGLFAPVHPDVAERHPCEPADWPALHHLFQLSERDVKRAAAAVLERPPALADHYSTYNVKHSWSAAVLRGYDGRADFIIKPSEMSKKWKAENPEKMAWTIRDTPLRAEYPELEPLIEQLPGKAHRIRLMNLAPGGGELKRHADITDPDAGTRDGHLCRIHIPLVTNPAVKFTSWMLDGSKVTRHMEARDVWYLDTRKPHTAVNGGDTARLHLVIDLESGPTLRKMLGDHTPVKPVARDLFGKLRHDVRLTRPGGIVHDVIRAELERRGERC